MNIFKYFIILAIPLNFIGFVIKYLTKIPNFLIVFILTLISYFTIKFITIHLNLVEASELSTFVLRNAIGVTFAAVLNKDLASGIEKGISGLMGNIKKTQLLEVSMKERLKEYRKGLYKKGLTVFFTDLLMVLICVSIKTSITMAIDYLVYTSLIALSTVLIEDITNKALSDKDKLNVQYFIVFVLAFASIGALSVAYFSSDWKVFISSLIVSSLLILATFFLAHFSYIPSLRTKEEVMKDLQDKKWKVYEKMEEDEIIEDMINTIKYYFKKDVWGAELDIQNPMFLGNKGVPQTAKGASFTSGNNTPIDTIVPYFKKIIATKDSVLAEKKR